MASYSDSKPKLVSERLDHSTTGITQDICTHMTPGMDEDAAKRLDDDFQNVSKKR
ncbi:MAG: hypothetical protein ACYC0L_08160 [Thermoleophilia bacterium]